MNLSLLWTERSSKKQLVFLAFLCAVLLSLAWPPLPFNFIIFFALVPLLRIEDQIKNHPSGGSRLFGLTYITFFIWNVLTTWWVWLASPGGAVLAIVLNSLLMTFPFFFYHKIKIHFGKRAGYIALCAFWLAFEYSHMNWDGTWPWLNLGNVWAGTPSWIQWYEWTGALGGTLWVWVVNIMIYEAIQSYTSTKRLGLSSFVTLPLAIVVPIIISYIIKPEDVESKAKENIVAVQPNIDPYNEKFSSSVEEQVAKLITLSKKAINENTVLLIWPETAIADDIDENNVALSPLIILVRDFLKEHPQLKLISGSNSYKTYAHEKEKTETARKMGSQEGWYDVFNTAMLLDSGANIALYHKSKLVPGVEKMPFPSLLGFLSNFAIDMGGITGSLGSQDSPSVFKINNKITAAPIICYESIFGEYVSEFVKNGANIITIITNDGWWGETPGYKQHLLYGALRAIETRRFIARSANTGISCFIMPSGRIIYATKFWVPAVVRSNFIVNKKLTFYTRHGDYLGVAAGWLGGALIISWLVIAIKRKKL